MLARGLGNQISSLALEVQTIDGSAHDILWIGTSAGVRRNQAVASDAGIARYSGR